MKTMDKSRLKDTLDELSRKRQVFAPVEVDGVKRFLLWEEGMEPAVEGRNADLSPKESVLPQSEEIFSYCQKGKELSLEEALPPSEERVVFGIRPCDVKALFLLDEVFLNRGYTDRPYSLRRENTLLVSLGCLKPEPTCFCESLGINPRMAEGADVVMHDLGERFGLEGNTERGEKFINEIQGLEESEEQAPAGETCSLQVSLKNVPQKLQHMFEHSIWEEFYRQCLNCGICTYLCPTCHCFDIQSETKGEKGFRFRCWDSCMFAEFTLMAGGYNPRPTAKERVRNRFLHKLCYFPQRFQKIGCVGCGRCLQKCPVNVDITRFIRRVNEVGIEDA